MRCTKAMVGVRHGAAVIHYGCGLSRFEEQ